MAIVGFNFNKISVEKKEAAKGKITINNNITIKKVEKKDLSLGTSKQDGVKFTFEFTSRYEPKFAEIRFEGDVLFLSGAEEVKKVITEWDKNKKVPKEIMAQVMNTALSKCNIEALIISRDVNLPPPIPLPSIGVDKKK